MSWSPVGNPGNAADPSTGFGAVPYNYDIGTYDVTTSQYSAFLNAVATTDPYSLYNSGMSVDYPAAGISQHGSSGSYSYSVVGNPNMPIFNVTWGDAARFVNWLENGEPTNLGEVAGSTETGTYALNGAVSDAGLLGVTRSAGAKIFLPSENEWYKAAYYKGGGTNAGYWTYPTKNNASPSNVLSATGTNNANFDSTSGFTDPTNFLTPVGAFADSPGPFGTYDMGGDLYQWNEAIDNGDSRGMRGGSLVNGFTSLASSSRDDLDPTNLSGFVGFRVASLPAVPEPSTGLLAVLACGVALLWRKRLAA